VGRWLLGLDSSINADEEPPMTLAYHDRGSRDA
jgi:hypothetical protein